MLAEQQKPVICNVTMSKTSHKQMSVQRSNDNGNVTAIAPVINNTMEKIYPGIYLTADRSAYTANDLKLYGFTHIIYIDKHINETIVVDANGNLNNRDNDNNNAATNEQCIDLTTANVCEQELLFGGPNFDILDLNFGESTYLTTVLPNCYKAVKFIEKALKNNGAVLVIDPASSKQKCVTIVVGYLMYKYNKNFLTAYQLLKRFHPNIELDRFFISQLYEYEPILQMQRTQSCGNSCSRELRSALLKRKKTYDDYHHFNSETMLSATILCSTDVFRMNADPMDILME